VFLPSVFPGEAKWLLRVAPCRDGPQTFQGTKYLMPLSSLQDATGSLTDVEACPIAFGQIFFSSLSLSVQIFGPLASVISDHPLLHLQHCPARAGLGNLTCYYADTSLDVMVFPEKGLHFHAAWLRS